MPSIKDLKKRIASVKNTQQTTRAMKMVSAAKLRRAQDAIQNQRPYAKSVADLIRQVVALQPAGTKIPYLARETAEDGAQKRVLFVVVSSDRGLCGGFNSNVIKATQRWLNANNQQYGDVKLGFVGRKGFDFFKTKKVNVGPNYTEVTGKVTFAKAKKLADNLLELYQNEEVDEVKFVYNEFKNAATQTVVIENFLPLAPTEASEKGGDAGVQIDPALFVVKPDAATLLKQLLNKNFAIQTFRILLESQASEHGARMSAMENATKNAGEMIRKLALQYNKQRQAGITKELLEIISGSESQKSSA